MFKQPSHISPALYAEKPVYRPAPGQQSNEDKQGKRCLCFENPRHPQMRAHARYSALSKVFLVLGATQTPRKVVFQCDLCNRILGESREPQVLYENAFTETVSEQAILTMRRFSG